jgi:excisionase family DNA binding protein
MERTLAKTAEVAQRYGTSAYTIRRLVAAGQLPAIRLSPKGHLRFDPREVEAFIERARGEAA